MNQQFLAPAHYPKWIGTFELLTAKLKDFNHRYEPAAIKFISQINHQKHLNKMAMLTQFCEEATSIFIELLTTRFRGLGPEALHEYKNDLVVSSSDRKCEESFRSEVTKIIETGAAEAGANQLFDTLYTSVSDFLTDTVFPEIRINIEEDHFLPAFCEMQDSFTTASYKIDMQFSSDDRVSSPFKDLSRNINRHIVHVLYSEFAESLISLFFEKLSERRTSRCNFRSTRNDPYSITYLSSFAAPFNDLPDADQTWVQPYFRKIKEDNFLYANKFSTDPPRNFLRKAYERAHTEVFFLKDCFDFNAGVKEKEKALELVFDGFIESYDNRIRGIQTRSFTWLLQDDYPRNQSRFYDIFELYCYCGQKVRTKTFLRECIRKAGDEMIGRLRVQDNNWNMRSLEAAISEIASYEERVVKRVELAGNLGVANLRVHMEKEFKKTFVDMFRNDIDGKVPEEYLAEYVQQVASKDVSFGSEDTHLRRLQDVNVIMKYMRQPDRFINYLERWIRICDPTQTLGRSLFFRQFLNMDNVKGHVSEDLGDHLQKAILADRVTFNDYAKSKVSVVQIQCNVPTLPMVEDLVHDLVEDSKIFYTVSVPSFHGNRKSIHMRMTGLQKEILELMLVWGSLEVGDIYKHMMRDDIEGQRSVAERRINAVLDSLMTMIPLLQRLPDGEEIEESDKILLNDILVFEGPYVEIERPLHGSPEIPTDRRYSLDMAICEFLQIQQQAPISAVMTHAMRFEAVNLDFLRWRLTLLEQRGFLTLSTDQPIIVSYLPH